MLETAFMILLLLAMQHDHAALQRRGAEAMGFDQRKARHHFRLLPDGGSIAIEALDPADGDTRDRIRRHIKQIESAFAAGDFAAPERIHAERPPGAATMARLAGEITYKSETRRAGARLRIRTANAKALGAIHEYLRYQIREHRTADPLRVKS